MTFAVGLREDAANAEYYVKKILPMSFYEPGKPVEKRARAPPKDAPPVEALDVPELVEMRQRLRDVLRGCEKMEREEKQCAAELQAATDRLATVEKRSAQLDDQLDQYDEQLAEERNRTLAASMDAEQTRAQHAGGLERGAELARPRPGVRAEGRGVRGAAGSAAPSGSRVQGWRRTRCCGKLKSTCVSPSTVPCRATQPRTWGRRERAVSSAGGGERESRRLFGAS